MEKASGDCLLMVWCHAKYYLPNFGHSSGPCHDSTTLHLLQHSLRLLVLLATPWGPVLMAVMQVGVSVHQVSEAVAAQGKANN